jgi:hypothetical protein
VDSDSPTLPVWHLEAAFGLLDAHDVVLGPTSDGGYYLVGARRSQDRLFVPGVLGTSSAREAIQQTAARLGLTCALAPAWYDVDTADDLRRLAAELRHDPGAAIDTAALLATWRRTPQLARLLGGPGS